VDPTVDTWRTVTLPLLRRAADLDDAVAAGLELRIVRRGARPGGGGEVALRVPALRELPHLDMTDEGMVRRIRGVAYSMRVRWRSSAHSTAYSVYACKTRVPVPAHMVGEAVQ
jgi:RNA 3'-terminal phosphate cyclase-like protein